jgi:trehalose/maltose hydrolase-like predicted phosphorylase
LVAARLGRVTEALELFRLGANIDLAVENGRAEAGVHMGALGGLWQAAILGVAGVRLRDDGIAVDPHLLPGWSAMEFPLRWRGRRLAVRITAEPLEVEIAVFEGGELAVSVVDGPAGRVRQGKRVRTRRESAGWTTWREEAA